MDTPRHAANMVTTMAESSGRGGGDPAGAPGERGRVSADIPPCHCVICDSESAASQTLTPAANEALADDDAPDDDDEDAVRALVPGWFGEAAAHVRRTGWTSIGILPGTKPPGWAFPVGLWHTYRTPEASLFGLLLPAIEQ